jgi:protease PrsW
MTIAASIRAVRITAIVACTFGAAVLIWQFVRLLAVFPAAAVLAAVAEVPLLVVGFVLARLLRPVRAPSLTWSGAALAWGGTAATGCALLANQGLTGLWAKGAGVGFAANWSASLTAPLNEEILKLCGVILVALAAPSVIRGPVDGMIIGALTGLGFQAVENVTYGLNAIVLTGATDPDRAVLNSFGLRVGMTGLGSHWTMTAVAGAGIGYFVLYARQRLGQTGSLRPPRRGVLAACACLATAMGMHLLFDAPGPGLLPKVAINFIVVVVLYLMLRTSFVSRARALLTDWAGADIVSAAEARTLTSRLKRRRELRRVDSPADRARLLERQSELLDRIDSEAA